MSRVNGKEKGAEFERSIANLLSKELTPLCFERSAGSGARLGGLNKAKLISFSKENAALFTSDVVCTSGSFQYSIECKFYKEKPSFDQVLLNKTHQVWSWWDQVCVDASSIEKEPVLFFKFNRTPVFVLLKSDDLVAKSICLKSEIFSRITIPGRTEELLLTTIDTFIKHYILSYL